MKRIVELFSNKKFDCFFKWFTLIVFGTYVFCILTFSGRKGLEKITFVPMILLCLSSLIILIGYKQIVLDWKLFWPFLFVIYIALITLFGTKKFSNVFTTFILSVSIIPCYITLQYSKSIVKALYSIAIPIIVFSIYFIILYRKSVFTFDLNARIGDEFGNVNDVSMNLLYGAIVSFILAIFKKQYWMYFFGAELSYLCLFAQSKKSILSLLIVLLFLVVWKLRDKPLILLFPFISVLVVLVLFFTVPQLRPITMRFVDMFASFSNEGINDSTTLRDIYFNTGMYLGLNNAFFGYGAEGFYSITTYGTYSHANVSELICDYGLLGFFLFYFPFPFVLLVNEHKKEIKSAFCFSFVIMMLVYSFTSIYYFSKMYYVFLAFAIFCSSKTDIRFLFSSDARKGLKYVDFSDSIAFLEVNL